MQEEQLHRSVSITLGLAACCCLVVLCHSSSRVLRCSSLVGHTCQTLPQTQTKLFAVSKGPLTIIQRSYSQHIVCRKTNLLRHRGNSHGKGGIVTPCGVSSQGFLDFHWSHVAVDEAWLQIPKSDSEGRVYSRPARHGAGRKLS